MDLSYNTEELAFRDEVRAFMRDDLPSEFSEKVRKGNELTKADMERWHAILNARGWLAPNWPSSFGGAEWNAVQRHIFEEEAAIIGADRACLGEGRKCQLVRLPAGIRDNKKDQKIHFWNPNPCFK